MNVVSFGGGTNSTAMIIGMYLHKIPIDLILFAGSGTTGVVAKRMGRGFVGCEINPSYVAMAAGRIAEVE